MHSFGVHKLDAYLLYLNAFLQVSFTLLRTFRVHQLNAYLQSRLL